MDSGSVKHCMMTRGTIGELIPSFRSQIDRHVEQICDIHHFAPLGPTQRGGGVQMVRRPYLRTTVVDFSSETCLIVVRIVTDDDLVENGVVGQDSGQFECCEACQ